jgi:hypothetical protein
MIVTAASLTIYTPCTPLPVPFGRSRYVKLLNAKVVRFSGPQWTHELILGVLDTVYGTPNNVLRGGRVSFARAILFLITKTPLTGDS